MIPEMSELPGPEPIDFREVENWLRSRGAAGNCPACGQENWTPHSRPLGLVAGDEQGRFIPGPVFAVSAFICGNCAFVRIHSPAILRRLQGQEG